MKTQKSLIFILIIPSLVFLSYCTKNSDTTPPSEVTTLKAVADNQKVTLSWTDPTDADFEKIEVSYLSNTQYIIKGIQTIEIDGLTNGSSYTFTVKTVDSNGNKSSGLQVSSTPMFLPDFGSGILHGYGFFIGHTYNTNGTEAPQFSLEFPSGFLNVGGTGQIEILSNGYSKNFDVKQDSTYKLTVYAYGSIGVCSNCSYDCPVLIGNLTIPLSDINASSSSYYYNITVTDITFLRIAKK